jgi:hypothetical protein
LVSINRLQALCLKGPLLYKDEPSRPSPLSSQP